MKWEMVVGLETHVELSTNTKIFCPCTTEFGGEPNTHCCPICSGQPGTLPSLNKKVVEYGIKAGLALNCEINKFSKMDRKHYVYPDMPKAYQISQYDMPLCQNGYIMLASGKKIRILRIHIEEDAGKLIHERGSYLVDYNRCGVPLIEIVTEPDFRSAQEVQEYLEKLQGIMRTIGVSDCRMQEGSIRCDVNISVKRYDEEKLGVRTEVKNLNSFVSIDTAINFEYERHTEALEREETLIQETRHFNSQTGETYNMRGKENADDYRYFREPDVIGIHVSQEEIDRIAKALPELPEKKIARYIGDLGLSETDAKLIAKYKKVSDYFEKGAQANPKTAAAFILTQMFNRISTETQREEWDVSVSACEFKELISLIDRGEINNNVAKMVFNKMLDEGKTAKEIIEREKIGSMDDDEFLELCKRVISENQAAVQDYKNGKEKAMQALIGAIMRHTRGAADPAQTTDKLKKLILDED